MSDSLRDELDQFVTDHGDDGRSELIREACQSLLEESQSFDDDVIERPFLGESRHRVEEVAAKSKIPPQT